MSVVGSVIVMTIVTTVTARVDTVHPNDYLTVDIDCRDHKIEVRLYEFAPEVRHQMSPLPMKKPEK